MITFVSTNMIKSHTGTLHVSPAEDTKRIKVTLSYQLCFYFRISLSYCS